MKRRNANAVPLDARSLKYRVLVDGLLLITLHLSSLAHAARSPPAAAASS